MCRTVFAGALLEKPHSMELCDLSFVHLLHKMFLMEGYDPRVEPVVR